MEILLSMWGMSITLGWRWYTSLHWQGCVVETCLCWWRFFPQFESHSCAWLIIRQISYFWPGIRWGIVYTFSPSLSLSFSLSLFLSLSLYLSLFFSLSLKKNESWRQGRRRKAAYGCWWQMVSWEIKRKDIQIVGQDRCVWKWIITSFLLMSDTFPFSAKTSFLKWNADWDGAATNYDKAGKRAKCLFHPSHYP